MAVKITLFCNAGMSTSLLVKRMQDEAAKQGKDYDINAYGLSFVPEEASKADVILVGPQVRHAVSMIKDKAGEKTPVVPIDMRMYGMIDAKGVLREAEKILAEKGLV